MQMEIIVGHSRHWIEAIGEMKKYMEDCDLVILEEPEDELFYGMLRREISVEEYMRHLKEDCFAKTPAFPKFSSSLYKVLIELFDRGIRAIQVDPYMSALENIYSIIYNMEGSASTDEILNTIERDPVLKEVYRVEKMRAAASIKYYSSFNDFNKAIEAIKELSRAEAEMLKLRIKLRASEICQRICSDKADRIYVEAGDLHTPLSGELARNLRKLGVKAQITPIFHLSGAVLRVTGGKLRYIFPPSHTIVLRRYWGIDEDDYDDILAARSLIRMMFLERGTERMPSSHEENPKMRSEIAIDRFVSSLDLEGCKRVFDDVMSGKPQLIAFF
ncbi:MAG: hypothetical protein C0200_04625 [Thermoproteota archaeon]|nr:MAG: hypothetical protein C0200_04625 [Candidatus Korarchaeota archaeon]